MLSIFLKNIIYKNPHNPLVKEEIMDKRGLVKVGMLVILILVILLIVLSSVFSSAVIEKEKYWA